MHSSAVEPPNGLQDVISSTPVWKLKKYFPSSFYIFLTETVKISFIGLWIFPSKTFTVLYK